MVDRIIKVTVRGDVSHLVSAGDKGATALKASADQMEAANTKGDKFRRTLTATGDAANKIKLSAVTRDTDAFGRAAARADVSINQLTGRLRLFADMFAILGPAAAPIGALAVPAVAGLANQLGVAALAGGSAIIAFQGVGDALKAVNEAAIAPTAANVEKARQALLDLSPAAQQLVVRLQELRPSMEGIVDVAAGGLFPGVLESLDNLETRIPEVERVVGNMSATLGNMLAEGTESLSTDRWDEFFDFLAVEAPETLVVMSRTVGDLTHGMAELWMAFDPLNDDFGSWLQDVAAGFDDWASGLAQTQGFREFIDYVRTTGPQVADTFGSLADAVLQIVQASAPLGGPVLQALEGIADVIATIADSDMGTPIMAGVAALALFSRGQRALQAVTATTWGAKAQTDVKGMAGSLGSLGTVMHRLGQSAENADAKTKAARATVAQYAGTFGKAAAGVGALAVATTGVADNAGLSNTAMLGLAGTMVGPFGAAIGATIGFALDASAANDELEASYQSLWTAISALDFAAAAKGIQETGQATDEMRASIEAGGSWTGGFDNIGNELNYIKDLFTDMGDEALQAQMDADLAFSNMVHNANLLADALSGGDDGDPRLLDMTMEQLTEFAQRAAPAAAAAGLDLEKVLTTGVGMPELEEAIRSYNREADSTPGRTNAVADALSALDDDLLSTAESAGQLAAALDTLLSPQMDLSEATDAFEGALRSLDDELAEGSRSLKGFSAGAIENKDAVRGLAQNLQALIVAQANAGAGPRQLARSLANGRDDIIAFGRAAGLSEKDLRDFLKQIGLTPRLVRTVLRTQGMDKATADARRLRAQYDSLPRNVRTFIRTNGVPKTRGELKDLEDKTGKLTKRERRILLSLKAEAARTGITNIGKLLANLDKKKAEPKADLNNAAFVKARESVDRSLQTLDKRKVEPTADLRKAPFDSSLAAANSALTRFGQRSESATITTTHRDVYVTERRKAATGGHIRGPGTATSDSIPAWLSDGEFVQRTAAVDYYGPGFMHAINSMQIPREQLPRFADGGRVSPAAQGYAVGGLVDQLRSQQMQMTHTYSSPVVNVTAPASVNGEQPVFQIAGDVITADSREFFREAEHHARVQRVLARRS